MSADLKDKAVHGLKSTWCNTWTFTANTGRRAKILGRYTLACWQQQKLNKAMRRLGAQTFQALERGEANPLAAPKVSQAVQKAKDLKEHKDKNYQAMEAIRERIRTSCVIPTPEQPGGLEETPEVP
ncbi:MAG: hypothetical protein ABIG94_02260 [Pseudomonadota bacterium]